MKTLTIIVSLLLFVACNEKNKKSEPKNNTQIVVAPKGTFSGNLAGKQYNVAIECSYFNEAYFTFRSDRTDVTDSNGDGLIISGFQKDKKLVLTIIDNGKTFSAANIQFTKGNNNASGVGKLFEEGTARSFEVSFKVACQ